MQCSITTTRRHKALSLIEAIVLTVVVSVLLAVMLSWIAKARERMLRANCTRNLLQLGIAFRGFGIDYGLTNSIWSFPMQLSVTNSGAQELVMGSNAWPIFQALSNEINNPVILHCPAERRKRPADSFSNLSDANISYFVGLDSADSLPNTLLLGDTTLMLGDTNMSRGLYVITSNAPPNWSASRHRLQGNILFGDGSVQNLTDAGLRQALISSDLATNRLLFP